MSDEEEPAPTAPGSEIGNDNVASDAEQASLAHKPERRETGLTKCDDEYTVSKQREALSAKANKVKFSGLRAGETPAWRGWWTWINHKTTFPILYEGFLFVMAHLMLSAQIERVFSAASLVSPSNRSSMDACYFQAQLCTLVNFLHLVHPEDICLLNPCQPKK